jgi:hypothetical protein
MHSGAGEASPRALLSECTAPNDALDRALEARAAIGIALKEKRDAAHSWLTSGTAAETPNAFYDFLYGSSAWRLCRKKGI